MSAQSIPIAGTWVVTQQWNNVDPYQFDITISDSGAINVAGGGFIGVASELGASSYIALAIASSSGDSVTAYSGNFAGGAMGGTMTGTGSSGVFSGIWSAQKQSYATAAKGRYGVGK